MLMPLFGERKKIEQAKKNWRNFFNCGWGNVEYVLYVEKVGKTKNRKRNGKLFHLNSM
jgi:hypothetical protein